MFADAFPANTEEKITASVRSVAAQDNLFRMFMSVPLSIEAREGAYKSYRPKEGEGPIIRDFSGKNQ